jgi:23S rRNA G2069 N7-methylase RlmK/C1962 C5-methylase RlmI
MDVTRVLVVEDEKRIADFISRGLESAGYQVATVHDGTSALEKIHEIEFDMIVLDPPKFAENKQHLTQACRGYKDINLLALQLLRPNGLLATFSCSGLMPEDLFHKVVADAALDTGRQVQFLQKFSQDRDHLVLSTYPEGYYLKGVLCRVARTPRSYESI